jgi:hypothetical protein
MGFVIAFFEFRCSCKSKNDWAHADSDFAFISLRVDNLGEFGAGHAARNSRDIHQHFPRVHRRQ